MRHFLLALALLVSFAPRGFAQSPPDSLRVRITAPAVFPPLRPMVGTLIQIDSTDFVVREPNGDRVTLIPKSLISRLEVSRSSGTAHEASVRVLRQGAMGGAFAGGLGMVLWGLNDGVGKEEPRNLGSRGLRGAAIGGLVGALVGGVAGTHAKERWEIVRIQDVTLGGGATVAINLVP